jgi:hypothetical protein
MSESDGDEFNQLSFACRNGVSVNLEGGYYCSGKQYSMEKKLAVAATYQHHKHFCGGRPSLSISRRTLGPGTMHWIRRIVLLSTA